MVSFQVLPVHDFRIEKSNRLHVFLHQILFQYIDDRICSGKANIFTGNHNREECVTTIGDRLTSRIFSEYAIEFVEGDKRGW